MCSHSYAGLKKLLKEGEPVPALYTDPLYVRSSYWVLSTSSIYCKHFRVYGWGEVSYTPLPVRSSHAVVSAGRPRWLRDSLHQWLRW